MSNRSLILFLASVAVAAALYFAFDRGGEVRPPLPSDEVADQASATNSILESKEAATAVSGVAAIPNRTINFDAIQSQGDLERAALRSDSSPGQIAEYVRMAALYCEARKASARTVKPTTSAQTPEQVANANYQTAFVARFCNGTSESFAEASDRFLTIDPGDDMRQAFELVNLEGKDAETIGYPRARDLVTNSTSPDAMIRAAAYLSVSDQSLPQAATIRPPGGLKPGQLMQSQILASKIAACSMRGGCGNGGIYTVFECSAAKTCRSGVTAFDVWQNANSPAQMAYARALAAEILASRSQKQ